ncbi:hypothetical protein [Streptomyces mayteni]
MPLPATGTWATAGRGGAQADAVLAAPEAGVPLLFVEVDTCHMDAQRIATKLGKYMRFLQRRVTDVDGKQRAMWRTRWEHPDSHHGQVLYPPLLLVFHQLGARSPEASFERVADLTRPHWAGRWEAAEEFHDYNDKIPLLFTTIDLLTEHGPAGAAFRRAGRQHFQTLPNAIGNARRDAALARSHARNQERARQHEAEQAAAREPSDPPAASAAPSSPTTTGSTPRTGTPPTTRTGTCAAPAPKRPPTAPEPNEKPPGARPADAADTPATTTNPPPTPSFATPPHRTGSTAPPAARSSPLRPAATGWPASSLVTDGPPDGQPQVRPLTNLVKPSGQASPGLVNRAQGLPGPPAWRQAGGGESATGCP